MRFFDGRLRWTLIFWMFIVSAISYLDRVNISIAGQAIQSEFSLTDVQLGYIFSAFVLGYALFQTPGGRLADRFGPRKVIALGVVWWSAFTAFTALVPSGLTISLWLMISVRFLLGIGEAVVFPASNRLVATWIPTQERGIANGWIFAGVGAGAGVTPPLITWVLLNWGWHASFYVSAVIGLAACLVWWILARDTPKQHPWIAEKEIAHIEAGLPAPSKSTGGQGVMSWGAILSNKNVLLLAASYFAYGYSAYIFFTWFFIYLSRVRGLDLKSSSLYSMLPFIAMATCSPLGGWIADILTKRHGRRVGRCGIGVVGLAGAAIFIALATQVQSGQVASMVLALGAGSLYLAQSSYWAVSADIAGRSAGSVSGLMNMGSQLGGALTASITPWIGGAFGWTASFLVAAVLCAFGSLAWWLVNPNPEGALKSAVAAKG